MLTIKSHQVAVLLLFGTDHGTGEESLSEHVSEHSRTLKKLRMNFFS